MQIVLKNVTVTKSRQRALKLAMAVPVITDTVDLFKSVGEAFLFWDGWKVKANLALDYATDFENFFVDAVIVNDRIIALRLMQALENGSVIPKLLKRYRQKEIRSHVK